MQDALRESEARYRTALAAGGFGSWETDLVAGARIWSKEGMALFGLDLPDGVGTVGGAADEYAAALHPDDRHLAERFHALAEEQDSFAAEYRVVRPDGKVVWLAGRGLVVARQPDGRAHRLVSIMSDVTERKRAEDVLRIERERLELALEAGQMGVYDLDMATDVLWWSPQTYALFGVTPETFVPSRHTVPTLMHPDDRAEFLARRAEAIARRLPFHHEFRVLRRDGSVVWISHRGRTDHDAAGRPVRSFGIALDVTERKLAEQALRDADRKKDGFIATLAHELRNPLAPIRNAVHLLRRSGSDDPQLAWCRDVIDRQVSAMSRLLEDLLDVSRLTRGQFALRREPLTMAAVIGQAVEVAQPVLDDARHALAVTLPPEPLPVEGDLTRLAQVFSNLLINAAKYTQPGGRIGLVVRADAAEVVASVSDNGIGIGAGQIPHIFEMFGQAEAALTRSQGGLGIGLALSRGLVEMHGGRIAAHSDGIGQGSVFTVRLPLASPVPAAGAQAGEAASVDHRRSGSVAPRILVADDLRDSADSLALLLQSQGYDTRVAYDGEHALDVLASFRADLCLLDLGMPKMNGYELCRRIRALPWGGEVRLVAQSGWGQEDDRRRTREAGFDRHLVKPIDPDALDAVLREIAAPPS